MINARPTTLGQRTTRHHPHLSQQALGAMANPREEVAAFYDEVASTGFLYTICDDGGFPAPKNSAGVRTQPFWSSLERVRKVTSTVPAYHGFKIAKLAWSDFRDQWVPGLSGDGVLIGVNWSGDRALGYDLDPHKVAASIQSRLDGGT